MIDKKKMRMVFCGLAAVICLLGGCKRGVPAMSDNNSINGYTYGEAMVVLATEKNQHEQLYTDQIWDVTINGTDTTYESYLLERIKGFLEDMKVMSLLAQEQKVALTAEEEDRMQQAAKEYFEGLTEQDKTFMQVSQDDVETMYRDYFLANKLVNEMTKDVDLEVSDSEAKVIRIMEITTDSEAQAKQAYEQAQQEGADFAAIAAQYQSDQQGPRLLGRGEASDAFEQAAFALETDQISQVVSDELGFHVIYCVSSYEEQETKLRKEQIYNARKQQAFRRIYDDFRSQVSLSYPQDYWQNLTFTSDQYGLQVDFFAIYQKYSV